MHHLSQENLRGFFVRSRLRNLIMLTVVVTLMISSFFVSNAITHAATSTASATSSCKVAPVDPKATRQAKNLLCYLYSIYGNHILSGQQESLTTGNPDYEMNYIHNATGRYPAVRGLDMDDRPGSIDRAIAWWKAGGIPLIGWHVGAPTKPDNYTGSQEQVSINATLTPGTAEYKSFVSRLDSAASNLARAQSAGVAILWRPFHEAGGTWFWWSKEGGSQYVRLWKFEFNYFTKTKGLHNLVWLMPYDGSPNSSFWPGKAYVDVAGADDYANDHGPLTSLYKATRNIAGSTIPIALHENGPIPTPSQLQSSGAKWVLFNTWNTTWLTGHNTQSFLRTVYSSSYVITRDRVPNLK